LPKILSNEKNAKINVIIPYGNNRERFKYINNFVENIRKENTILPDSLFDSKLLNKIYKEEIGDKEPEK
jgi:hypothetical protein